MSNPNEGKIEEQPKNPELLNRSSKVATNENKKNYYQIIVVVLVGFLLVLLTVVLPWKDKKQTEQGNQNQNRDEFNTSSRTPPPLQTEPLVQSPSEPKGPSGEEVEKMKKAEALKEARLKSALVVYNNSGSGSAQAVSNPSSSGGYGENGMGGEGAGSLNNPNGSNANGSTEDRNTKFQKETQGNRAEGSKAIYLGSLDKMILQGKLINAVLETAINSDLPGMVRAIVSTDVYAESGNQCLIPKGSRLVGQYNSQVQRGQTRVFVIWNRVIRPDGVEVAINSAGTDALGRAGLDGRVNTHFWTIFGTSTLLSIIGAGTAVGGVGLYDQYNSLSAYRQEVANSFSQSAQTVLGSYASIPPTINIKQGKLIKVFVARDLDFTDALAYFQKNSTLMIP